MPKYNNSVTCKDDIQWKNVRIKRRGKNYTTFDLFFLIIINFNLINPWFLGREPKCKKFILHYVETTFKPNLANKSFVIEIKPKMLSVSDGRTYERTQ